MLDYAATLELNLDFTYWKQLLNYCYIKRRTFSFNSEYHSHILIIKLNKHYFLKLFTLIGVEFYISLYKNPTKPSLLAQTHIEHSHSTDNQNFEFTKLVWNSYTNHSLNNDKTNINKILSQI